MFVSSRSPKKIITFWFFLIFERKCVKMEGVLEVIFSMFFRSFSHWSPFGCPWVHFPWLLGSPGIILAPFWVPWASFWHPWGPPKWCPGSAKFNENESSNQPGWVHFSWVLKSLDIISALLTPATVDPALPGSLKFNENESSKEPGEVHCSGSSKSLGIIL